MSEKRLRNYTVDVRETRVFLDTIEVQASSAEEACELAVEEFRCSWTDSVELDMAATVRSVREP
ncbi:hypothetical protein L6V77_03295 [Myxococcota bacterium]|jgi:hypothetical protein|nr:hypothetical protein [Myxococcota bacterium]